MSQVEPLLPVQRHGRPAGPREDAVVRLLPVARAARRVRDAAVLRGRARESAEVREVLREAERGTGGLALVEGAPGAGKSRLLAEARAVAERRGMRTFASGGDPEGRTASLGPVLRAFSAGREPLFAPGRMNEFAELPGQDFWVVQEIRERLERAALAGPVAVFIDDVQWCDETSLLALRSLPRSLAGAPVAWLLAARSTGLPDRARGAVARLVKATGGRRIRLGPLGAEAVGELAGDILGAEPDESVLRLAAAAEGNPLMLRELFEGLRDEGGVTVRSGRGRLAGGRMPRRFGASIRRRLAHLPRTARDFTEAASVLGRSCPVDLMAELLEIPPGSLAEPLREVLDSGLMTDAGGGWSSATTWCARPSRSWRRRRAAGSSSGGPSTCSWLAGCR